MNEIEADNKTSEKIIGGMTIYMIMLSLIVIGRWFTTGTILFMTDRLIDFTVIVMTGVFFFFEHKIMKKKREKKVEHITTDEQKVE